MHGRDPKCAAPFSTQEMNALRTWMMHNEKLANP
jgi:hypothetical protein